MDESKHREENETPEARLVSRREALRLIGFGSAAILTSSTQGATQSEGPAACVVRPRHIEGPFFVDTTLNRSDIRSDPGSGIVKAGVPLRITFRVSQLNGSRCFPLTGAQVDLWQCDANGLYSATTDYQASTVGQRFLRGYQFTDRKGIASFTTIYPGWYPNRTVHIHFKIRTESSSGQGREFTSQIYFDDDITDIVHSQSAYASRPARKVRNGRDLLYLFRGSQLLLPLREEKRGYTGTFDITLDL